MASYGLVPNMILYLMNDYKVGIAKGQNIIFLSGAATNFTPLLGAFLADSYLGRFLTIGFGSIFSFLVSSSSPTYFYIISMHAHICFPLISSFIILYHRRPMYVRLCISNPNKCFSIGNNYGFSSFIIFYFLNNVVKEY